jgi:hypothetical protein
MTAWRVLDPDSGHEGVRHWTWSEAPEWVRGYATLNGDDISDVSWVPNDQAVSLDSIASYAYCTVVVRATPKGLLIFGHHA